MSKYELHGYSVTDQQLAKWIKLPGIYTVATLPRYQSVGTGCLAWVSDSHAGQSGGLVVAATDGWRFVTLTPVS